MMVKMYLLLFNTLIPLCMCSLEFCIYKNVNNEYAYCAKDASNQTVDSIPRVTNNITTLNLYGQPLGQLGKNAFENVISARFLLNLELLFCQISFVDAEAFLQLDSLSDLTLSFNKLREVNSETFQHVKHVKNIYMASNHIEMLSKGLFANLARLEGVHLGYNSIRSIEAGAFANTPSLQYIVLSNNQLQHLDLAFMDRPSTVANLYLHENPWICDSNLEAVASFYARLPGYVALTYMPKCGDKQTSSRYYWDERFSISYLEILEPTNGTKECLDKGSKCTLSCKVYGFPKPDVKWQKDSTNIDSGSLTTYVGNNTYYLNYTFTVEQNATYDCIASNTNVTKRANETIDLSYIEAGNTNTVRKEILLIVLLTFVLIIILICVIICVFWKRKPNFQNSPEHIPLRDMHEAETSENPRNSQEDTETTNLQ